MDANGLKVVESKRRSVSNLDNNTVIIDNESNASDRLLNSVADNFGNILNLANDIVEIKKMSVQSEAIIAKMKEERAILLSEAEAYAKRKNADTTSIVEKMKVIQAMMKDFYQFNNSNMTSEDFSKVITEIVTQMGRID
ncbi:MAG: hypothetical protein IJ086_07105 [Clostridium sp.]|nr:hypothetical protein [Clostridium sp.]